MQILWERASQTVEHVKFFVSIENHIRYKRAGAEIGSRGGNWVVSQFECNKKNMLFCDANYPILQLQNSMFCATIFICLNAQASSI